MNALLISILLFGIARSSEIDNDRTPTEDSLKRGLSTKCAARETSACIAHELVTYVDRMLRTASVQLSDDLMIVDER
ncbi:hypothetical protein O3G_MSEX012136 [Manduca sexta]|uniref:Uncharacterized protein n=1 Tax=Manduca sexta TaxID=7130 RepID=A0A921ZNU4_MANSE|nr:hypothetical protein O3G_MSEX012136 [Manduca sexta]